MKLIEWRKKVWVLIDTQGRKRVGLNLSVRGEKMKDADKSTSSSFFTCLFLSSLSMYSIYCRIFFNFPFRVLKLGNRASQTSRTWKGKKKEKRNQWEQVEEENESTRTDTNNVKQNLKERKLHSISTLCLTYFPSSLFPLISVFFCIFTLAFLILQ